MHQLDDLSFVTRLDPKEMYRLTCEFPQQCRRALEISKNTPLPTWSASPDLALLTGLGGSAAGGDFVKALIEDGGKVPFFVNRDYHLPAYVKSGALVFACSYSGNTEETLSAYADAKRRGANLVCVTSGGKLAEMAKADGFPVILVPGGQPPRTCLGYLLIPVMYVCEQLGLIPKQDYEALFAHLEKSVAEWAVEVPFENNPTKQLAQAMFGNVAVLYGLGSWQGIVANRWKGQINENSKNLAFPNSFPELNHNEILGWVLADKQGVAKWLQIVLEDGTESAKMKKRAEVTAELTKGVSELHRVLAKGDTLAQKMLSLASYGDFVSIYLAALNAIDPENIDSINILKAELSKID